MANNSGTGTLNSEGKAKALGSDIKNLQAQEIELTHAVTRGELTTDEALIKKQAIQKKINDLTQALSYDAEQQEETDKQTEKQQEDNEKKEEKHSEKEKKEKEKRLREQHEEEEANKNVVKTNKEKEKYTDDANEASALPQDTNFNPNDETGTIGSSDQGFTSQNTSPQTDPASPSSTSSDAKPEDAQDKDITIEKNLRTSQSTPSSPVEQTTTNNMPITARNPAKKLSKSQDTYKTNERKKNKTGGIYKYTPLGFLIGKISPHTKERDLGKKIATNISSVNAQQKERKIQKKSKAISSTKKTAKATFNWYKNVYKASPLGILYGKTKHLIPPSLAMGIKKILPKKKTSPNKPHPEERKPKTAKDYQKIEINKILTKAVANGFDRFELLRKIRDAKVWQSKAWKYGRYAISPLGAASYELYKRRRELRQKQEERTNPSPSTPNMQSRILRSGVRNRSPFPMISNMNKNLGKSLRNKTAQKAASSAAKKGGQQLAKKALQQVTMTFLKTPAGWVTIGVVGVIILFFGFVMTVITLVSDNSGGSAIGGGTGGGGSVVQPPTENPIPNFTLQKTVSQTELAEVGEITYTISYAFTPSSTVKKEDIIIFDQIPENTTLVDNKTSGNYTLDTTDRTLSWNLSDSGNAEASSFSFTVLPEKTDMMVENFAWAQASTSTPVPGGAQSSNACTRPKEGTGFCSYEYLLPYFNNQPELALTASLICNLESGSDPFAANKVCPDYSIGLFQINLVAHCGGAFNPPPTCAIINTSLKNACEQRFLDPIENIQYAYQLYLSGGTGWTSNKWSTYTTAKSILDACGNI